MYKGAVCELFCTGYREVCFVTQWPNVDTAVCGVYRECIELRGIVGNYEYALYNLFLAR